MAQLLARHLEGEFQQVTWSCEPGRLTKMGALLPSLRRGSADILLVACVPGHLQWALGNGLRRPSYGRLSAWLIDSFWTDRIPKIARRGAFDQFFI
ncbi:MAG: hypothetical protein ACK5MP_09850 [Nostocoides sp.]